MREHIRLICGIDGYTLIVFYTTKRCWQFRFISPDGSVYGSKGIFYTSEAAEMAGRSWVRTYFY